MNAAQTWLVETTGDWLVGGRTDVTRASTDLGHIGELKLHDGIVLRVSGLPENAAGLLLHRASYDTYARSAWLARDARMQALPDPGSAREWPLPTAGPGDVSSRTLQVSDVLSGRRRVLSLPAGTSHVASAEFESLSRNRLGAVQARGRPGPFSYRVAYLPGAAIGGQPAAGDLKLPRAESEALGRIAAELQLDGARPQHAAARLLAHFEAALVRQDARAIDEARLRANEALDQLGGHDVFQ